MDEHTHTELELPTVPVFWLNTVLIGGNGKTSVQKLWVIEQMDCGRAGWIQDDAEAGMQAGESSAPMTFKVALMAASWLAPMASMVAPMASMAPVVASRASLASMVETWEWLNLMVAEPKGDDERAGGLTLRYEGVLTVALELASMVTEWMAPMTPLMTSMAPIASLASMVASMDLMMHKFCEERVDGLILKIDGVRVQRLTHNITEERADGLSQRLVDDDGSESGGCRWTNTSTTSCLRRTQRKFESSSALDCVRCEKTWLRMAQVTPSTVFALRKWVESLTWVVTQSGVCSSFVEIENEVHDEECWRGWSDDGLGGVEWWRRWLRWRR